MKSKQGIVILSLLSIFLLLSGGCVDKKKVDDIEKSQKVILDKITAIEKNLNKISKKVPQKKPTSNYSRSEEHTSELQSHSFISYAVFCLKKKKKN